MIKRLLLPTQKDDVFKILEVFGLSHADFVWNIQPNEYDHQIKQSVLELKGTDYYFFFGQDRDGQRFMPVWSPGHDTTEVRLFDRDTPWSEGADWDQTAECVGRWGQSLTRQLNAENLWDQLKRQADNITKAFAPGVGNAPFTSGEKTKLSASLKKLEQALVDIAIKESDTAEEIKALRKAVDANFQYLHLKMDTFGKKDWLLLFMGALLQMAADTAFPGDVRMKILSNLYSYVAEFVSSALNLGQP